MMTFAMLLVTVNCALAGLLVRANVKAWRREVDARRVMKSVAVAYRHVAEAADACGITLDHDAVTQGLGFERPPRPRRPRQ
jgi:hypothetical protein